MPYDFKLRRRILDRFSHEHRIPSFFFSFLSSFKQAKVIRLINVYT